MKNILALCAAAFSAVAAGCGTVQSLWGGGAAEQPRARTDVTEFRCEANKKLLVRIEPGGASAWVAFPEREFRLDQVPGASGQYSNGRATLTARDGALSLEEGPGVSFANCRRASGS